MKRTERGWDQPEACVHPAQEQSEESPRREGVLPHPRGCAGAISKPERRQEVPDRHRRVVDRVQLEQDAAGLFTATAVKRRRSHRAPHQPRPAPASSATPSAGASTATTSPTSPPGRRRGEPATSSSADSGGRCAGARGASPSPSCRAAPFQLSTLAARCNCLSHASSRAQGAWLRKV